VTHHLAQQRVGNSGGNTSLIPKERVAQKRGPYSAARSHPSGLTRKEAEILALLEEGASNLDIASKLKRSRRTVEHHVSAILTKLGVETRMAAALLSIKQARRLDVRTSKKR
jgi:DNA-binding NarL/FixJ family response regulator